MSSLLVNSRRSHPSLPVPACLSFPYLLPHLLLPPLSSQSRWRRSTTAQQQEFTWYVSFPSFCSPAASAPRADYASPSLADVYPRPSARRNEPIHLHPRVLHQIHLPGRLSGEETALLHHLCSRMRVRLPSFTSSKLYSSTLTVLAASFRSQQTRPPPPLVHDR